MYFQPLIFSMSDERFCQYILRAPQWVANLNVGGGTARNERRDGGEVLNFCTFSLNLERQTVWQMRSNRCCDTEI